MLKGTCLFAGPRHEINERLEAAPLRVSATTLVLVRHGETAWNVERRIQGHTDTPLNGLGVEQAKAVGKRLARERFDAIYSSDLIRALHTARAALPDPGQSIIQDQRLRERHLGVLQGLTDAQALAHQPAAWRSLESRDAGLALAGGESLGEFSRRVISFLDHMLEAHAGERVLVVTHGGVLDVAYRHVSALPLSESRNFPVYNASVNILAHDGRDWRIASWGDVSHLALEMAIDDM